MVMRLTIINVKVIMKVIYIILMKIQVILIVQKIAEKINIIKEIWNMMNMQIIMNILNIFI